MMLDLATWQARFKAAERACPWPGPRPFSEDDDPRLLVGRDKAAEEFRRTVAENPVVLLHGPSGVGKSSLLTKRLRPALEEAGKTLGYCGEWSRAGSFDTPAHFLAQKLYPQFADHVEGATPDPYLFPLLHELYGKNLVLVLDQFEELVRYSPTSARGMKLLVKGLADRYEIKVVLSFRSEYQHELRDLENELGPWAVTQYYLEDIPDASARDLITRVNEVSERNEDGFTFIDEAAAVELHQRWIAERTPADGFVDTDPFGRIGLLHLQGALYALFFAVGGRTIRREDIEQLDEGAHRLFQQGLIDAIGVKLELCDRLAREGADGTPGSGADAWLRAGARQTIVGMSRHLSSGGYKLNREARELLDAILDDDLDRLLRGVARARSGPQDAEDGALDPAEHGRPSQVDHLLRSLLDLVMAEEGSDDERTRPGPGPVDLLSSTADEIAVWLDGEAEGPGWSRPWAERLHRGAPPWEVDRDDVTAGPTMGAAPAVVLIEELRRFAFALACLRTSHLIRTTSPDGSATQVSLIHDGFGRALDLWAAREQRRAALALHRLTAPTGASYFWKDAEDPVSFTGTTDDRVVIANLRGRGTWVSADFRHVVFVNCDFRGSFFHECAFEGVSLLNCQLDGAIFSGCTAEGPADLYQGGWEPELPRFLVRDVPELTAAFRRYAGAPSGTQAVLHSPEPGRPAEPWVGGPEPETWKREAGGLVLYGGRVSSLVLRRTKIEDGSLLGFRDVAGSGLDVVEHGGGRFEFHGSALRHVTFTDDGYDDTYGPYTVTSVGSKLVQLWIGDGVEGTWTARDCHLVQVHNGSRLTFSIEPAASGEEPTAYYQLDGVEVAVDSVELRMTEELVESYARAMDYRENPARLAAGGRAAPG
jgi:hypothetical protein